MNSAAAEEVPKVPEPEPESIVVTSKEEINESFVSPTVSFFDGIEEIGDNPKALRFILSLLAMAVMYVWLSLNQRMEELSGKFERDSQLGKRVANDHDDRITHVEMEISKIRKRANMTSRGPYAGPST